MKLDKILCCMFLFSILSLTAYEPSFVTLTKVLLLLLLGRASNFLLKSSIIHNVIGNHSLLRGRFWDVTQRSPQRNGCSHPNNIPFHCLANHSFRSIFENLVAPNSPFETCPIRDQFLSSHHMVGNSYINNADNGDNCDS